MKVRLLNLQVYIHICFKYHIYIYIYDIYIYMFPSMFILKYVLKYGYLLVIEGLYSSLQV
jgi:hypothetical protein